MFCLSQGLPLRSFIPRAASGVIGISSALEPAASSSLLLFGALTLGFVAFFFEAESAGVFGSESFSLVAVLGVFAGL